MALAPVLLNPFPLPLTRVTLFFLRDFIWCVFLFCIPLLWFFCFFLPCLLATWLSK